MPSVSQSVPVPTRGWNARDPVTEMDPQDAIRLVNLFPNTGTVDLRGGYRVHSTSLGSGAVQTLAEFAGPTGTRQLIAGANNKVYNATTLGADATDITNGATITVNKWQTANFGATLILVNGTDQPLQWDGTTLTSATYTGVTDNNLIHVSVYKSRLYFVEKNSCSIWYGGVGEITGALTELDVTNLLQRGGYVEFTASFSRDVGDSTDDLFTIVSNMGEVLLYSGDYPGALNWVQVARYFLYKPLGRRGYLQRGSDLILITEAGLIPLSGVLRNTESDRVFLTDRINNAFRQASILYSGNFGWQAIAYPRGHYMLVNIPTSESADAEQYVMNTDTGAWTRFTGQRACSWCLLNEKLYFGGIDGKVYQADYGTSDAASNIEVDMKGAFSFLGDKQRNKRFVMARPTVTADGDVSFAFNVDVDFGNRTISDTVTISENTGAEWDEASWDVDDWVSDAVHSTNWYTVTAIGRSVAPRLSGNFQNIMFSISAIDYLYEPGGLI